MVKNLASNAGNLGSVSGWGTKIPHAVRQLEPVNHKLKEKKSTNSGLLGL